MAYLYADTLQVLYFGAGLTVEEQLVPFKSRYPLKLNLLGKPPKYRIKIWLQIHNTMKTIIQTGFTSQKVSVAYVIKKLLHC